MYYVAVWLSATYLKEENYHCWWPAPYDIARDIARWLETFGNVVRWPATLVTLADGRHHWHMTDGWQQH